MWLAADDENQVGLFPNRRRGAATGSRRRDGIGRLRPAQPGAARPLTTIKPNAAS